jgi:hypothetical protein
MKTFWNTSKTTQGTCRLPEHQQPADSWVSYNVETGTHADAWSCTAFWLSWKWSPSNHNGTPNQERKDLAQFSQCQRSINKSMWRLTRLSQMIMFLLSVFWTVSDCWLLKWCPW